MWTSLRNIPLLFLLIAVFALPFSLFICHASLILFVISAVIQGRTIFNIQIFHDYRILLFTALLIVFLAGMLYTDNIGNGWVHLERKVFFFVIPFTIAIFLKIKKVEVIIILCTFVLSCLVASLDRKSVV